MVSEVIYTKKSLFDKEKIKKQKKTLIPKSWGLGLGLFALLISLGGLAVAIWLIIDSNSKLTGTQVKKVVLDSLLHNYAKSYVNPDNENAALQQDIENLRNISVTKSSLSSYGVSFNDYFLAQSKMLGKGIANVNDKVQVVWNNFIDKHFMKARVIGTSVIQDSFSITSFNNSDLTSLNDTTGPLGISSNLFVGSTADPKTLHVTGDTVLDRELDVEGDIKAKGSLNLMGAANLLSNVTVGSTTTAADLTVTGETNLLNRVTVGTSTTPADLDVTGEASVEGVSSLLGDVTIGSTTGTAANLLVTGTTEVRGTTSLLADVTVGSNSNVADLEVFGETTLVDNTAIINGVPASGTSTQKILDIGYNGTDDTITTDDSITTIRGNLDLSGTNVIGLTASGLSTLTNLLVTETTEIKGTTSFLSNVTIGEEQGKAADLTVNGNLIVGRLGADGVLGGNDDSTSIIRGNLNLENVNVIGLIQTSSREISNSSSAFNVSSLGIQNGNKINLFVKLRISGGETSEYLKMKQITYNNNSNHTYQFEFPFHYSVYTEDLATIPRTVKTIGVVERRIIVKVYITSLGNISIQNPYFKQYSRFLYPRVWKSWFFFKKRLSR